MDHWADAVSLNVVPSTAMVPSGSGLDRGVRLWGLLFVVLLAGLELVWLRWFLAEPLPNASNQSTAIRRSFLLWRALPHAVPGLTWRESFLGQAALELSHVENLHQRLPIVAAAVLVGSAAVGLGEISLAVLRLRTAVSTLERLALNFGLGAAGLGVLTLLAGRAGLLHPWIFRVGLGAIALCGLAVSRFCRRRIPWPEISLRWVVPGLIIAPFLLIMFLGAMLPAIDFDVLEYHLQGPKEYYQAGRIAFLPHNVYTNMPFGVEMLHVLGMEVLGDWWGGGLAGQLLVAFFAPAAAVLIAAATASAGSPRGGWLAAIIYLSTPWVYRIAVIAYVEGPLCFYHAALVWAIIRFWNDAAVPRARFWRLCGLLAGAAMSCKYTAFVSAVIPLGALAMVEAAGCRSWKPATALVLGWSFFMVPWLGKNVLDTGNPVYPLAHRVFGGRPWDETRQTQWFRAHGPKAVTSSALWNSVVDVAGRSDWQSPLYLAFAPLAFLRRGTRRTASLVAGFAAYLFATWWLLTHRMDRFWLPMLPPLAILAGLGADWSPRLEWRLVRNLIMAIALLTSLVHCSTALCGLNEWTGSLSVLRSDVPRRLNKPLATVDRQLPADARILLVGQAAVFHMNHQILYNTVFNPEIIESLASGMTPREFQAELKRQGITHVYVDWKEIARHRDPAGYGFTDFVTRERFDRWVKSGVLAPATPVDREQNLYAVR